MKEELAMPILRKAVRPSQEHLRAVRLSAGRWMPGGSGAIDWSRLDDGEAAEVSALFEKLRDAASRVDHHDGDSPDYLAARDRAKYLRLISRAAGHEDGYLAALEERAKATAGMRKMVAKLRIPKPQVMLEEPGTVVLPPELFRGLTSGRMTFLEFAYAAYLLAQFQCGPATRFCELEADGSLLLKRAMPSDLDPRGEFTTAADTLMALGEGNGFSVDRLGPGGFRVRLGAVLNAAFERRAARVRRAA